jgi:predicted Zn finger-like uncharacterized protein
MKLRKIIQEEVKNFLSESYSDDIDDFDQFPREDMRDFPERDWEKGDPCPSCGAEYYIEEANSAIDDRVGYKCAECFQLFDHNGFMIDDISNSNRRDWKVREDYHSDGYGG